MRTAVYCGTRNAYWCMTPAAKSLVYCTNVEKIYFLIEDDVFPEPLPDIIETINVSGQPWIDRNGPNAKGRFTWMNMVRAALPKILAEDVVLNLDYDTIFLHDCPEIFDINIGDNFFAGVREPKKSGEYPYINYGVSIHNLKLLRETGMCDQLISALNAKKYACPMQDSMYELCKGMVMTIDGAYNATKYTEYTETPKILHYAAVPCWERHEFVEMYRNTDWEAVL